MSLSKFTELYARVRSLPTDEKKLHKNNKDELSNFLSNASEALLNAEKLITSQADIIMKTNLINASVLGEWLCVSFAPGVFCPLFISLVRGL